MAGIGTIVAMIKALGNKTDQEIAQIEEDVTDVKNAIQGIHQIPSGGATNQVLAKNSSADYDLKWMTTSSGDITPKRTESGWKSGSYDAETGWEMESANYIRNSLEIGKYFQYSGAECDDGYLFLPRAWNRETGAYIGTLQTDDTFAVGTNYKLVTSFDFSSYPNYAIRIAMRKNPASSSITTSDGQHCRFIENTEYKEYFNNNVKDEIEYGSMDVNYGTLYSTHDTYKNYRRSSHIIKVNDPVIISFDERDRASISSFSVMKYSVNNGVIEYNGRVSSITNFENYIYVPSALTKFIKIVLTVKSGNYSHEFHNVSFYSKSDLAIRNNPNIAHYEDDKPIIEVVYKVCDDVVTSGQLILPTNYTTDGEPVPLHVFCHGTGGMIKWDSDMTELSTYSLLEEFQYHADEGFAVFDCYPWTSKYYKDSRQISPFMLPIHEMAYLEGIKYICSRFNVDINKVCVSGLSLGGNMAAWFAHQTLIPIKAVALMAPTTGWISLRWEEFFLEENARARIVNILGLSEETGANTFVETVYGLRSSTVKEFVEDHLEKFAGLAIAGLGTSGATYADQYDYLKTGVSTMPQWMIDKDLPAIPETMVEKGIPSMVNHPDLCCYAPTPIKFWQAFDDVNVSAHANYTWYQWMLNGGTQVYWRTLANGHGGHGATGYKPEAERTSGTTRLGITYTNVPVAQVEMIDFFYDCLGR